MAGLDGIQNKIEPPAPDRQGPLRAGAGGGRQDQVDARLAWARCSTRWRRDHDFLLKGDVFTPDLIETWIDYKRERELAPVALRPHPYEFFLYYDV